MSRAKPLRKPLRKPSQAAPSAQSDESPVEIVALSVSEVTYACQEAMSVPYRRPIFWVRPFEPSVKVQ